MSARKPTVNSLSVALGVAVKDGVLVSGQHLSLSRHLLLPSLEGLECLALLCESSVEGGHDVVDGLQAHSVAALLELGQTPGDLPEKTAG